MNAFNMEIIVRLIRFVLVILQWNNSVYDPVLDIYRYVLIDQISTNSMKS